jgi:hypothetical protein
MAETRLDWARCTKTMFNRCNDGRMEPWRGGDGHGGSEWFYTCDRCGITS